VQRQQEADAAASGCCCCCCCLLSASATANCRDRSAPSEECRAGQTATAAARSTIEAMYSTRVQCAAAGSCGKLWLAIGGTCTFMQRPFVSGTQTLAKANRQFAQRGSAHPDAAPLLNVIIIQRTPASALAGTAGAGVRCTCQHQQRRRAESDRQSRNERERPRRAAAAAAVAAALPAFWCWSSGRPLFFMLNR
jgi:hypothetical protein